MSDLPASIEGFDFSVSENVHPVDRRSADRFKSKTRPPFPFLKGILEIEIPRKKHERRSSSVSVV